MNIFGFEIHRRRSRVRLIVRATAMSEQEINHALAMASEETPLYRAFMQLIETARENSTRNAGAAADNPTKMAGYVGGGEHLLMLRDDVMDRREMELEASRQKDGLNQGNESGK